MSDLESRVAAHYGIDGLEQRIIGALAAGGIDTSHLTVEDLAPVDEFHIGGAEATAVLLDHLKLSRGDRLLDIGCGIGGPARLAASRTGAHVTGIDLTDSYVAIAGHLSQTVGLAGSTRFVQGSALALPFDAASFDAAMMLHVGMNLADKPLLMREAARVLKPGAVFAVYDIMRLADGPLAFPLPWAPSAEDSFAATPDGYRGAAEAAGFRTEAERERGASALDFFARMRARQQAAETEGRPPPPGLGLVMDDARAKIANLIAALESGILAPVELILRLA